MFKQDILAIANDLLGDGPMRGVEFFTKWMDAIYRRSDQEPEWRKPFNLVETMNEFVKNGDIIEVEYTLGIMDYRVKSLYFRKDTQITLIEPSAS